MNKINNKTKGLLKEKLVAHYLIKKGWTIVFQNKKILGVEIDILAEKNREQILVEVKSIQTADQIENILKEKQKGRLKKAAESLCEASNFSIQLFLATVDNQNQIDFFEIS
ncbi:MAG: YraN family protein [Oligoflexia bacterium]|nr:YraN family protein [Oligoflexia bacterium]